VTLRPIGLITRRKPNWNCRDPCEMPPIVPKVAALFQLVLGLPKSMWLNT